MSKAGELTDEQMLNGEHYYFFLDEKDRLTLMWPVHIPVKEAIENTTNAFKQHQVNKQIELLKAILEKMPDYGGKLSRKYFQPNSDPQIAHRNGYRLAAREAIEVITAELLKLAPPDQEDKER